MNSPAHSDLSQLLTKYYFGDDVSHVIKKLFTYDLLTLNTLQAESPALKRADLKKALLIAVKYQLVDYVKRVKNNRSQYEYSLAVDRLFSFFRITRFIQSLGNQDGKYANTILKYIAEKALVSRSKLLENLGPGELRKAVEDDLDYMLKLGYVVNLGDCLCLNIEKLSRTFRDSMIAQTIENYYGKEPKIKALCEAILRISRDNTAVDANITAPVPFTLLTENLVPKDFPDRSQLESYLERLSGEINNRFVASLGVYTGKGHMYAIDSGLVIDYMVKETISSMITSRFGPRCCRVFRVLLCRGPLMLKQIEDCVMLPAKDVREYTYMLIKEGLLRNQQVPKTPDFAPSKSLFIQSVELDQVVLQSADHCCRTICNLLIRYNHEVSVNKTILDRSKAVQDLLKSEPTDDEQEVWSQYFNSHEMAKLDQVKCKLEKILFAKAQVDDMLYLLQTWIAVRPDLRDVNP